MMNFIKGNIRTIIFESDNGFFVGTFKIKETNDEVLQEKINKVITVTGLLLDPNCDDTYELTGKYIRNERYGYQFTFDSYEKLKPEGKDAVVEFLASNLIKGCGARTAKKIVETLGEKAIELIKENKNNLMLVPDMSAIRAEKIYQSIIDYSLVNDILINLKKLGFSINESTKIVKKYQDKTMMYVNENLYYFKEIVPFEKLDRIFKNNHDPYDEVRLSACTLEAMEYLSNKNGDIYYFQEEIIDCLKQQYKIFLDEAMFETITKELINKNLIVKQDEKYFLAKLDMMEQEIARMLFDIESNPSKSFKNFENKINRLQEELDVVYNEEQKRAIYNALNNRVSIISGGPGTGKTTIVNAITKLYIEYYKLSPIETSVNIALLAPTGRASKKLSLATNLKASKIHRYLKWNKDTNEFQVNEYNKNHHKLIIVDEVSMVDTYLFYSLLCGIDDDVKLVLVGDTFQLPSVGPGLILNDLVLSNKFSFTSLSTIYRQSSNSYIPYLAKEIKEKNLSEEYLNKKDDYNFLECMSQNIKEMIRKIILKSIKKGINEDDIIVLAPMYKGENGIDNLNQMLQNIINPPSKDKIEINYFDVVYRENDKVLQLVNNPDCNVYNGDIGHIKKIMYSLDKKRTYSVLIDFDGNEVIYEKEDLSSIKHAYAITIHKSQGSEFSHVILPVCKNYYKMLYNKLIYTGVSRAKKSLVIVGEETSFLRAVNNDYAEKRKTDLLNKIENKFNEIDSY